jgi:hypothetical protein
MTGIPYHKFSNVFLLMNGEEFETFVADIKANGLREPITLYQGKILEGRNRYRACLRLQIEPQFEEFEGDDADAYAFVISKNISRRHLKPADKKKAAADLLRMKPEQSDRSIARQVGISHPTVAAVREEIESQSTGKSFQLSEPEQEVDATVQTGQLSEPKPEPKRIGRDGKARKRPAKKKANQTKQPQRAEVAKLVRAWVKASPEAKREFVRELGGRLGARGSPGSPSTSPVEKGNYAAAERAAIDLLDRLAQIADEYEVELDPVDFICEHYDLVLLRKEDTPDEIADKVVEAIGNDRARDEAKKIGLSIKQSAGKPPLPDCGLCKGSGLMEVEIGIGKTFKAECRCIRRKGSDEAYRAAQQEARAERETLEREMQQPFSFGVEAATKDGKVWASGVRLRTEEETKLYIDGHARWELKKHGYQAWEGDPDKPCDITFEIKRYDEPPVMWFEKVKGRKHPVFCFPHGTCGLMNWRPIAGGECECKRCKKAQRQRKAHERWLEAFRKNNEIIKQAFAAGKISQKQRDEWDNSPCNKTPKWLTQLKKAAKKTDKAKSTKKAKFALADASDPGTLAAAPPKNSRRAATSPTRCNGSDQVQSAAGEIVGAGSDPGPIPECLRRDRVS